MRIDAVYQHRIWPTTGFVAVVLAGTGFGVTPCAGGEWVSNIGISINGKPLVTSVPPMTQNGRVMLPMRDIFEALGATVQWNPANQSIAATSGTTTINLQMNNRSATVNGQVMTLEQPPASLHGRIMLPLRFVSEALNAGVAWDPVSRRVNIKTARDVAPTDRIEVRTAPGTRYPLPDDNTKMPPAIAPATPPPPTPPLKPPGRTPPTPCGNELGGLDDL